MGQSPSADAEADAADDADDPTTPDVDLSQATIDALSRAADALGHDEALAFEGLRVARDDAGFVFEADGEVRKGLDDAGLREVAAEHPTLVSNWHFWEGVVGDAGPRRSFLYWLETGEHPDESATRRTGVDAASAVRDRYVALAEGIQREWGQLLLTVTLADDGARRYEVRHADEAGADHEDLELHDEPQDARRLVKFDDDGRYRPLKTAPSLPTGWAFADLDQRDAYETVETIYPATVANWDRERRGELDVSHWHETMERQTGMFGLIETWDRQEGHEHVEWVAEACCDDSQCVKRREWGYDEDIELGVDGGDGEFPCREPCSVVVSAARKWTKLEAEAERTYEFELTPSEKEQVEEIIDAVADGRTEEIREADLGEGANRYRARYLRAKRFDEDGNLGSVPTDPDVDE
ncbi:MAG: DR2241 family protein [Halopenitus sp.]